MATNYLVINSAYTGSEITEFEEIEDALAYMDDDYHYSMRLFAVSEIKTARRSVVLDLEDEVRLAE